MKFKKWFLEYGDTGWDWDLEMRKKDPLGIWQAGYEPLYRQAMVNTTTGIANAIRKAGEETGAKTDHLGQVGVLPSKFYDMLKRHGDMIHMTVCIPTNYPNLIRNDEVDHTILRKAAIQRVKTVLANQEFGGNLRLVSSKYLIQNVQERGEDPDKQCVRAIVQLRLSPTATTNKLNPQTAPVNNDPYGSPFDAYDVGSPFNTASGIGSPFSK